MPLSLLLGVLLLAGACGGEDDAPEGSAIQSRDSAGVEIVEVARDAWAEGEGWTVSAGPTLTIGGGADPDQELYRVRGAVRLSDGRVAVANAGTQEIRVFGPDGAFLHAMGGEGEGPGEFSSMFGLQRRGDTLVAHDFSPSRLTAFDAEGAYLGTTSIEHGGNLTLEVFPTSYGSVGLHLEYTRDVPSDLKYARRPARYVRYGRDGAPLGVIDTLPGREMLYRGGTEGNTTYMVTTQPLIAHQQHQAVVGDRLVAGVTDRFEIRVYAPDGSLERLIRAPLRERGVTPEEWGQVVQEEIEDREDTPEARREVAELAEAAPAPEVRPAFGRFVADRAGYVWVAPYRPEPGPTVPWLVVDLEGPILGTVDLPDGFRPTEIGPDYVLGTVRDDLDVQTVVLYGLTR